MLVDITRTTVSVLESIAFEMASRTTYCRSTGIPAGRYHPDPEISANCTNIDELIECIRKKRVAHPYSFVTDCLCGERASFRVDPKSVLISVWRGHVYVSAADADVTVRVRAFDLQTAVRKVALVSPEFEVAIIENANGAQALRLSAETPARDVQIAAWLATEHSLSRWVSGDE